MWLCYDCETFIFPTDSGQNSNKSWGMRVCIHNVKKRNQVKLWRLHKYLLLSKISDGWSHTKFKVQGGVLFVPETTHIEHPIWFSSSLFWLLPGWSNYCHHNEYFVRIHHHRDTQICQGRRRMRLECKVEMKLKLFKPDVDSVSTQTQEYFFLCTQILYIIYPTRCSLFWWCVHAWCV